MQQTTRADLGLDHLWIVYPGDRKFPLTKDITALPLTEIGSIRPTFTTGNQGVSP